MLKGLADTQTDIWLEIKEKNWAPKHPVDMLGFYKLLNTNAVMFKSRYRTNIQ